MVNFRRRDGVNIVAVTESIEHDFVVAEIRHQAKFDLRIVGAEEHIALSRDKRLADFAAHIVAPRDVLQIWIGRRQAACGGHGLVVSGVNAPCAMID